MATSNRPSICVPITALVQFGIINEARGIASNPDIDMAEWRVDYFAGNDEEICPVIEKLNEILADKKLVVTLRTTNEGGEENGDRFDYAGVIGSVIEQDVADYVDIEIDRIAENTDLEKCIESAKTKNIRTIGSFHDFEKMRTSDEIEAILDKSRTLGLDVGKIACMANSDEDADTMLTATGKYHDAHPDYDIITIAMGKPGYITRLYGGLYGSIVSFAALEKSSAPGQRSVEDLKRVFDRIYAKPNHIFLIGFMGTGKSTIAREISDLYDMPEIDTDTLIEEKCGRKISDIFAEDGEAIFRMIETGVLDELGTWERSVISCGGGVALKDLNVRKLREMGRIVWLQASPETVYKRVHNSDSRPLLNGNMNVDYISELMSKRLPAYEAAADITVVTDGRDVSDIANEVMMKAKTS